MKQDVIILRPTAGAKAFVLAWYVAGIVGLPVRVSERFRIIATAAYAIVGAFWLVDIFRARIVLQPDGILIVSALRSLTFPRAELQSVTWEAGCGVSIKLREGKWVRLPHVEPNSQALTNKIRAWLKRGA